MRRFLSVVLAVMVILGCIVMAGNDSARVNAADDGVTQFVTRLYSICLDRTPDAGGLNQWVSVLKDKKATGCSAAYGFVFSNEFQSRNMSNTDYITCMYKAFFGRDPDATGLRDWVKALDGGASRERIFCGFANSTEFDLLCQKYGIVRGYHVEGYNFSQVAQVNLFVDRLYNAVLGRPCDSAGMADWTTVLVNRSATGVSAAYGFFFSSEFKSKTYCNEHYVAVLYYALMGRNADAAGLQSWVKALDDGASREQVFKGFAESNEFTNICASYGITRGSYTVAVGEKTTGVCPICGELVNYTGFRKVGSMLYYYENNKRITGFKTVDSKTYYFDPKTYAAVNGYQQISNKSYYFKDNVMQIGFINHNGFVGYAESHGWLQSGWITYNGKKYYMSPSTFTAVKGNQTIDGKNYFFNNDYTQFTGLQTLNNGHYSYFDPNNNGARTTGWKTIGSDRYYFDSNGASVDGLQTISNNHYYFINNKLATGFISHNGFVTYTSSDGIILTGIQTVNGKKYYISPTTYRAVKGEVLVGSSSFLFNDDYTMFTGLKSLGNGYYSYYNPYNNGALTVGWATVGSDTYYFDANGRSFKGIVSIAGSYYFFDSNSHKATGWQQENGKWYYFDAANNGKAKSGWLQDGGKWYFLGPDYVMQTEWVQDNGKWYYMDGSGVMQEGWIHVGADWYFATRGSGELKTGWFQEGSAWYYFYEDSCAMAHDCTLTIGGTVYRFASDGHML